MKIDIVVVTYNRLEKLKHALECYDSQTVLFRNLIVVNNCSTDGTSEFLDKWWRQPTAYHKVVINTKENLGGSGGFYVGQKYALDHDADWVFLADDDAYADKDMIKNFVAFLKIHECSKVAAVCAAVHQLDGNICTYHRYYSYIYKHHFLKLTPSKAIDYQSEYFEFDILSYVGPFVNCKALKSVGLVNPSYFIYCDDGEHSLRLKKYGILLCVPSIKITHEGGAEERKSDNNIIYSWRDYYQNRNYMNMTLRHYPLVAIYQWLRFLVVEYIPHHHDVYYKMKKKSLADGLFNHLGKHPLYKPGWQINN